MYNWCCSKYTARFSCPYHIRVDEGFHLYNKTSTIRLRESTWFALYSNWFYSIPLLIFSQVVIVGALEFTFVSRTLCHKERGDSSEMQRRVLVYSVV